jgi:hypothetical protein
MTFRRVVTAGLLLVIAVSGEAHLDTPTPPQLVNESPVVAPYTATAGSTLILNK